MTYFSHELDPATFYCTGCGVHLSKLQESRDMRGKQPKPVCAQVTGISHLVRKAS